MRHGLLLLAASALLFANYYCYDIPAALNVPIQRHIDAPYAQWQWQVNLLYSVYSLPNIFLPLIGGMLVDRLGTKTMLFSFSALVCLGHAVFTIGLQLKMFSLMVLGRVIFGLGGESLEVAQAKVTTDWFHGRSLAFALGMNLSSARVATGANDNLSPFLARYFGPVTASWVGFVICLMSFLSAIAMIALDRDSSRIKAGVKPNRCPTKPLQLNSHSIKSPSRSVNSDVYQALSNTSNSLSAPRSSYSPSHPSPSSSFHITISRARSKSPTKALSINLDSKSLTSPNSDDSLEEYDEEDETVHCSQMKAFSSSFWLLCLCTICMYGAASPFFHVCTDFFMDKWYKDDIQKAGMRTFSSVSL